ncbi:homocysteine S-methyltransferase [Saccharibacillus sp. JS10]|uniref:homocysteine S-methyltransferase n=1 Tax=Saccharibacillus sp. JS10 TaxID=2950552 RepID=UPI00210AC2C1|nr:homocysteine S-methyltransferase [Saccharibacillus sp. JS10]MCQ4088672.1 homocysteine S-methyltransferase [Saccharibacillus sp. JS10]
MNTVNRKENKKENPIAAILNHYPILILDGAMATELERYGSNLDDSLWSARVLLEQPELISKVHEAYFRAGADCAITASYQATVEGFAAKGISEQEALALIQLTVELASKARDTVWAEVDQMTRPKPIVAGSVGAYGAFLADGSEYTGNYGVDDRRLRDFHRPRIQALIEAGADLLAFETIPSLQEAKVLAELLADEFPDAYAWMSFSLQNGERISEGTLLRECAQTLEPYTQIAAIGVNCAPASFAAQAIETLASETDKPLLIYPNSGETYDAKTKTWQAGESQTCGSFAESAEIWHRAGAKVIGGCCRTTPEQIAQISKAWRK